MAWHTLLKRANCIILSGIERADFTGIKQIWKGKNEINNLVTKAFIQHTVYMTVSLYTCTFVVKLLVLAEIKVRKIKGTQQSATDIFM
jgi:hypothetical protein